MKSTVRSTLLTRLDMLWASIPDVAPCRTKRGRVRKCIRFVELCRRVEQLYEIARTAPQRRLVDGLIAEIHHRRDKVADEQAYERSLKAKKQRLREALERSRPWFEGSSSDRPSYPDIVRMLLQRQDAADAATSSVGQSADCEES